MKQTAGNPAEAVEASRPQTQRTKTGAAREVGAIPVTVENGPSATVVASRRAAEVIAGSIAAERDVAIESDPREKRAMTSAPGLGR